MTTATNFLRNRIVAAYDGDHHNAFVLGAGRDTIGRIVNEGFWYQYTDREVRSELDRMVSYGILWGFPWVCLSIRVLKCHISW